MGVSPFNPKLRTSTSLGTPERSQVSIWEHNADIKPFRQLQKEELDMTEWDIKLTERTHNPDLTWVSPLPQCPQ